MSIRMLSLGLLCVTAVGTPLRAQELQLATSSALPDPVEIDVDPVLAAYRVFETTGYARIIRPEQADGYVIYPFGHERPVVRCPRLNACMILLERGEALTDQPLAGDTERWIIETSLMGRGQESRLIVIKPQACDIATNMLIPTTRRVYELALVSDRCNNAGAGESYTRQVKFWYPDQMRAERAVQDQVLEKAAPPALRPSTLGPGALRPKADSVEATQSKARETAPAPTLNHNYEIDRGWFLGRKDYPWIPAEVFDDGTRTYVLLPDQPGTARLPILYELEGDKRQVLNYTLRGDTIVADRVLERAVLLVGTGDGQREITIEKRDEARKEEES